MKSTVKMRTGKKITVRRTGDVRLTSAACQCPYSVSAA
jgi:hypothetical protein